MNEVYRDAKNFPNVNFCMVEPKNGSDTYVKTTVAEVGHFLNDLDAGDGSTLRPFIKADRWVVPRKFVEEFLKEKSYTGTNEEIKEAIMEYRRTHEMKENDLEIETEKFLAKGRQERKL